MELAFICSPYGGKDQNVTLAKTFMKMAAAKGYYPVAPHVMIHGILDDNDPEIRSQAISANLQLVDACKRVFVFGSDITAGMNVEIEYARSKSYGIVFVKEPEIIQWLAEKIKTDGDILYSIRNKLISCC